MRKKLILVSTVILVLATITIVTAEGGNPVEALYLQIIQKLGGIETAITELEVNPTVNVYPNVSVTNEVPVPSVNVENTVPVPNVTNEITVTSGGGIVISLKCSWRGDCSTCRSSCTPPSCPEGFVNLGTGSVPTLVSGDRLFGYSERWCTKY